MTKVREGIESMLSGKVGNLVFVHRQGTTYVRSAPKRKKDSSTPAMLLNQKRFGEIMRFCGLFKDSVIPQIWNLAADGTSGFRLFQKTNSPAFGKEGELDDPKKISLSTGKITLPQGLVAQRSETEPNAVVVSWTEDRKLGGIHLYDELMAISAGDGLYSDILATRIVRNNLGGSFELPESPLPASHIYLFFGSRDRRDYSQSVCFEL